MLITRAPLRLSLAGGGTDIQAYYQRHGGMVVSTSIDKYVYVFISPNAHSSVQVSSSDYATFLRHTGEIPADDGKLRYARAFLREYGINSGCAMFIASEVPPGTGLGSSSSLAVALTKALEAMRQALPGKADVAAKAADMEIERLGMPTGRQDHYAASFGGLNAIRFGAAGVEVEPLQVAESTRAWLQDSLMMFFTGQARESREILAEQERRSHDQNDATVSALHALRGHAEAMRTALLTADHDSVGKILHEGWLQKRQLAARISNPSIDAAYEEALEAGAVGGKIAGAGGGGFLILVCPTSRQADVTERMEGRGFVRSDFQLDAAGARILVNNAAN